jgi:hypothetical protein
MELTSPKGLIAFCEKKQRYEKGFKAWLVLGPYLLGAFLLERIVNATGETSSIKLALWIVFLAYLITFPAIWRRILNRRKSPETLATLPGSAATH